MRQDNETAAAAASVDHAAHADLLDDLMARVAPCFARRETRLACRDMVNGLLSELEDHNCQPLAEAAGHASPYRMRHLLSRARVDERQLLDAAADWAAAHLTAGQDEDDVVLIVGETADEKSSADCAGAARRYSGTVGGIAMCQVAVTLTCAPPAGHALIGRALYLPADWAAGEECRELAGVPDDVHLPQRHRLVPLPVRVAVLRPLPRTGLDQAMADQDPAGAHPRRTRLTPEPAQLMGDPDQTPPRVLAADLADRRFDLWRDLVRRRLRPPGAVRQRPQAAFGISADPGMHTLPAHPEPSRDLRHRNPGPDLENSPVALLDNRHLHQCQSRPSASPAPANDE